MVCDMKGPSTCQLSLLFLLSTPSTNSLTSFQKFLYGLFYMTSAFPWIFSLFLQGIKLEEQKPGPQKNKVGWVGEVAVRGLGE